MEKLKLNEELVNYVESLSFEVESRRKIVVYMIANGYDVKDENFLEYQRQFKEAMVQNEQAKQEIEKTIKDCAKCGKVKWNLDFESGEVSYEEV